MTSSASPASGVRPLLGEPSPATRSLQDRGWTVTGRADIGAVRGEMQDAWVIVEDALLPGGDTGLVCGVFDGLGGMRNGALAARTAADAAMRHLSDHRLGEDLLPALNREVRETLGGTTALLIGLPPLPWASCAREDGHGVAATRTNVRGTPGEASAQDQRQVDVWVHSVGDGSCFHLDPETHEITSVAPHDRVRRHMLSDYLGHDAAGGHRRCVQAKPGSAILICTDGVDGYARRSTLRKVLEADPQDAEAALQRLFEEIYEAGAPDNATAVLAIADRG